METTLLVFVLSIQSSYLKNSELPAVEGRADTVQFLVLPAASWRIKTFAVDEDVHVYSLGPSRPDEVIVVTASTERTYGDVIAKRYVVTSKTGIAGLKDELKRLGLDDSIEVSDQGFAFAVPKDSHYRTKSTPKP
jgi:hypothetical protein